MDFKKLSMKLKIGVFGVGHLGKIHIKCIQQIDNYELVGFYDPSDENAQELVKRGIKRYATEADLIAAIDVVDIVTPTPEHFQIAKKAIQANKDVFIEKPITHTIDEAEALIELNKIHNRKVQIGHVERFNPAFLGLKEQLLNPMFIEGHRLSMFNPRGTDVSVIQDLMIHDIDIVLHMVDSEIKNVHASGVSVMSDSPDICNARIEFENGCVANLTASRISLKQMRKLRMFQQDAYISIDFLAKKLEVIRLLDEEAKLKSENPNLMELEVKNKKRWIDVNMPEIVSNNAILDELSALSNSVINDTAVVVDMQAGIKALKVVKSILTAIDKGKTNGTKYAN